MDLEWKDFATGTNINFRLDQSPVFSYVTFVHEPPFKSCMLNNNLGSVCFRIK